MGLFSKEGWRDLLLITAIVLLLVGCGASRETPRMTADTYISQLWVAYESSGYEVNELDEGSKSSGTDADIGEYDYTGHIVSDGVYVSTYERDGILLRVQIWMDLTLATGPDVELGAFAMGNLLKYADPDSCEDLSASLGLDTMTEGVYEAEGSAGHYKVLMWPMTSQSIHIIYTLSPPSEE